MAIGEVGVFQMGRKQLYHFLLFHIILLAYHMHAAYRAGSEIESAIVAVKSHLCRRDQRVTNVPERCRPTMSVI